MTPGQSPSPDAMSAEYEATLFGLIGDWTSDASAIFLSGMITSRQGWVETPYVPCPAPLDMLALTAVTTRIRDIPCYFLPGVCQTKPSADVMRGEELQLLGAVVSRASEQGFQQQAPPKSHEVPLDAPSIIILPGTHSKWATVCGMTLKHFHTIMTGELYDLVLNRSLAGAFALPGTWCDTAFLDGVSRGFKRATPVTELFTCRSSVLLELETAETVSAALSGLLIGNEIREGLQLLGLSERHSSVALSLVGNPALCQRYRVALQHCGITVTDTAEDTAIEGFSALLRTLPPVAGPQQ